ncbi:MAG: DUF2064 domain-containing protein [Bacteroidota bacterium]
MNPTTAILLFSRTAAAEAQSKGFGGMASGNIRVATSLITRTTVTLERTGLPVFRSDESSQRGNSFGERLTNAMAEVYDRGYERILVVGNDCPSVRTRHLRAAAQLLESGKNVLGPNRRGGIWLLGLQRKDFCAARLTGLSWQSEEIYAELAAWLPETERLSSLADVNALTDLRREWTHWRSLLAELADLLFAPTVAFVTAIFCPVTTGPIHTGRGPPAVASFC